MTVLLFLVGVLRLIGYLTEPLPHSERLHAVIGEPSRVYEVPAPEGRLNVVTWNIERGARYERVRDALATLDADVYLLQEVDLGVRRSRYRHVARDLAHDLGLNWVFGGEFQEIGEAGRNVPAITGQAVLSRHPIHDATALRFENQARYRWRFDPFQPRRGGRIALRVETAGVIFYNAHIESAKDDRFRHKQVHEMLDHLLHSDEDRAVVFGGDFNTKDAPHASPVVRCLTSEAFSDALGSGAGTRRTSVNRARPLDWIFVRNAAASAGRVVDVPGASDHFPLQTTITSTAAFSRVANASRSASGTRYATPGAHANR